MISGARHVRFLVSEVTGSVSRRCHFHFVPCVRLRRFRKLLFDSIDTFLGVFRRDRFSCTRLRTATRTFRSPRLVGGDPRATPSGQLVTTVPSCGGMIINVYITVSVNLRGVQRGYPLFGR